MTGKQFKSLQDKINREYYELMKFKGGFPVIQSKKYQEEQRRIEQHINSLRLRMV